MMASHEAQPILKSICFFQLVLFQVGVKMYLLSQNPNGGYVSPIIGLNLAELLWTSHLPTIHWHSQNLTDFVI